MVVGYFKQYALLVPARMKPGYTQGPGFDPKPEIIVPIRVDAISQVLTASDSVLVVYTDGSNYQVRFIPIGGDQSGVNLPGGSQDGMRNLFFDWVSSINKGIPTPRLDEWYANATSDSIGNATMNTFLQMIGSQTAGSVTSTTNPYKKYLRLFRKDVGAYYSTLVPVDSVVGGETSQYSLVSTTGKWKWLQEDGKQKEITYSVPSNMNMNLTNTYYPGAWDFIKIQIITRSVIIDGAAAKDCLDAMTKMNFQNIGTTGQGPGVQWTITYNTGVSSTTKLEYEYYIEDGAIQGGTAGVPRLALRIPNSEAVPGNWEDFAYLTSGFGSVINGVVGPNFNNVTSGDDIWANSLTSAINNLNDSAENVATFTPPEGFDITNLA